MLYAVLYVKKLYNLKKNLYGDFSLERFLYEGCLAGKFYPKRFLNFRFLYVGFTVMQAAMVERTVNGHKGSQGTRGSRSVDTSNFLCTPGNKGFGNPL